MNPRTWPLPSNTPPFTALPISTATTKPQPHHHPFPHSPPQHRRPFSNDRDFSSLPSDLLSRIAAPFTHPSLTAASMVCRSWNEALRPLREGMVLLRLGKRFKHGRGGTRKDLGTALELYLKGAGMGCSLAMVDAGILYWEMGKREDAVGMYRRAAELGDAAGQCNLGIAYLQVEPPLLKEAIRWLYKAADAGHARAQYQLALCLHQGRGVDRNVPEAARWYLRAAEGGYARAMYNASLCYSAGEGIHQSHQLAKKWMKRAADHGHSKAQFEHGLSLFSGGAMMKAVVYLELARRAGEVGAAPVRNIILQQLSASSHDRAMLLADNWRALPSIR